MFVLLCRTTERRALWFLKGNERRYWYWLGLIFSISSLIQFSFTGVCWSTPCHWVKVGWVIPRDSQVVVNHWYEDDRGWNLLSWFSKCTFKRFSNILYYRCFQDWFLWKFLFLCVYLIIKAKFRLKVQAFSCKMHNDLSMFCLFFSLSLFLSYKYLVLITADNRWIYVDCAVTHYT